MSVYVVLGHREPDASRVYGVFDSPARAAIAMRYLETREAELRAVFDVEEWPVSASFVAWCRDYTASQEREVAER